MSKPKYMKGDCIRSLDDLVLQDVFNIGKTVFLTREEADHELKRVKGW